MSEHVELEYDQLPTDAPAEVRQYRNPSLLAILTVILALLSITALTSTMLWFLPWLTVVLGAVTLRILKKHPEKMGRRPVVFALMLAVFMGTLPPAKLYTREIMLKDKAIAYANKWFDLVKKNQLDLAYQLHVPRVQRIEQNMSFEEYYKETPGVKVDYDNFYSTGALRVLRTHLPTAKVRYDSLLAYFPELDYDIFLLRYTLEYQEKGQTKSVPVNIDIVRDRRVAEDGFHDWYVGHVDFPPDEEDSF